MTQTVFLTGFPGFLGSALVRSLLERYPAEVTISCLVQAKYRPMAEERARIVELEAEGGAEGDNHGRVLLLDGDITTPDLGLDPATYTTLQQNSVEIYHLAAVYDLGVGRDLAFRVNVDGTRHLLDFAQNCPNLTRFQYVSTCYISGRHDGIFTEKHLSTSQTFNNFYEETKYLAEVEVQKRMAAGLPTTIYRPSIVIGDSKTGATQKYDGPYYIMRWIMRQSHLAIVPVTGDPRAYEVNVVPRDYVINALNYLSGVSHSRNKVYQLCDPHPLTVDDMLTAIGEATERSLLRVPVPKAVAKGALDVPLVQKLMQIEPEAVEYFVQPTRYRCPQTLADLAGSGITCPRVPDYIDKLVAFMRAHPDISSHAMV
jgi:thioester reductase-like protein